MRHIERLHVLSLILTVLATILMYAGVLYPSWWILKQNMRYTVKSFSLFGPIHCTDNMCYPDVGVSFAVAVPVPPEVQVYTAEPGPSVPPLSAVATQYDVETHVVRTEGPPHLSGWNTGWLLAGRIFAIMSLTLVTVALKLQITFLRKDNRLLQITFFGFLIASALVSFITGFLFINKFSTLTRVYVTERPPGALTYSPAPPGCLLISSLLCVVAAVFTLIAFHLPNRNTDYS